MDISSIMTTVVVTIEMDDTLQTISEIFAKARFHHLLVVEDNELRGIISDRDVLKASSPFINTLAEQKRDIETLNKRAHQIMTRQPITITKEHRLEDAVELLLRENVSCLPVVSPEGGIEGIVTWKDLIRAYVRKKNKR